MLSSKIKNKKQNSNFSRLWIPMKDVRGKKITVSKYILLKKGKLENGLFNRK